MRRVFFKHTFGFPGHSKAPLSHFLVWGKMRLVCDTARGEFSQSLLCYICFQLVLYDFCYKW